jgi:hypothetical protein
MTKRSNKTKAAVAIATEPEALRACGPKLTQGYITKHEVAALLGKKPKTVQRWMTKGIIPYIKIGKGKRATVLFSWPVVVEHFNAKFGRGGDTR